MAHAPQAATYTNDPAHKILDRVRLEIGDTDCRVAYLSDEEIKFYIDEEPSVLRAAARCAGLIAARLARRVDFSHGPVRKSISQAYAHYLELEAALERRANETAVPEALGVTIAEKEAADADDGRVQPDFKKGMHDNPLAGDVVLSDPNRDRVY